MRSKIRKVLCTCLGIVMVFGVSISSMAAPKDQNLKSSSIDSNSFSISRSQMSPEQTENYERVMSGQSEMLPTQLGETKVVSQDENGTMMVTLVESSDDNVNSMSRAATTSSRTFVYAYKNALGISKDAFKVALVCSWNKNGYNSYITNLNGTYTVLSSAFSCSWDNDSYASNAYHALYLNVYYGGSSTYYIYSASLVSGSSPYISFAGTAY